MDHHFKPFAAALCLHCASIVRLQFDASSQLRLNFSILLCISHWIEMLLVQLNCQFHRRIKLKPQIDAPPKKCITILRFESYASESLTHNEKKKKKNRQRLCLSLVRCKGNFSLHIHIICIWLALVQRQNLPLNGAQFSALAQSVHDESQNTSKCLISCLKDETHQDKIRFKSQVVVSKLCGEEDENDRIRRESEVNRSLQKRLSIDSTINNKQQINDDLLELLGQFYAHSREKELLVDHYVNLIKLSSALNEKTKKEINLEEIKMKLGADDDSLLKWLRQQQDRFSSFKNTTFELLNEAPNRTINVCLDGPKILVLPKVNDILYCYTREQWVEKLWSDLLFHLSAVHYPIIVLNILIFLFGTTGNIFVCLSVYRNHQLRNVTNYFIVNLAFADFLVILICLPATVVWDLSLTWFFGTISCKLIMFLQDVSISVSVLTLTAISIDRYYAICYPLRFKSSLSKATKIIVLIWIVSLITMAPDLIYLSAKASQEISEAGLDTVLYSDCNYDWSEQHSRVFQFVKTILLYLLPFIFMFCAHFKIMQTLKEASKSVHFELQSTMKQVEQFTIKLAQQQQQQHRTPAQSVANQSRQIRFSQMDAKQEEDDEQLALTSRPSLPSNNGSKVARRSLSEFWKTFSLNNRQPNSKATTLAYQLNNRASISSYQINFNPELESAVANNNNSEQLLVSMHNKHKLESRRAAAKMLMTIVVIFGICYLPVHLINFLRQFIEDIPQNDVTSTISMLAHCICYLNSALNPIIYNHMNSIFRDEFKKFLSCFHCRRGGAASKRGAPIDQEARKWRSQSAIHANSNNNIASQRNNINFLELQQPTSGDKCADRGEQVTNGDCSFNVTDVVV